MEDWVRNHPILFSVILIGIIFSLAFVPIILVLSDGEPTPEEKQVNEDNPERIIQEIPENHEEEIISQPSVQIPEISETPKIEPQIELEEQDEPEEPVQEVDRSCVSDDYNCGDFLTCEEVMVVFSQCENDPNELDRDKDGIPCESLCN